MEKIGFTGLLSLIFAAAKVFGFISWSWLWVFSPLWITLALALGIFVIGLAIAGIVAVFS